MGVEIERKFLVTNDRWRSLATPVLYRQGYILKYNGITLRVRVAGEQGYLAVKGRVEQLSRPEFEYPIPLEDAQDMLQRWCHPHIVEKRRYHIPINGLLWEVDEFLGLNQGLVIAEVELESPDQSIPLPDWVGDEVSHQSCYYNSYLSRHPFTSWTQQPPTDSVIV